jgi:hypothetical protein
MHRELANFAEAETPNDPQFRCMIDASRYRQKLVYLETTDNFDYH